MTPDLRELLKNIDEIFSIESKRVISEEEALSDVMVVKKPEGSYIKTLLNKKHKYINNQTKFL